MLNAESALDQRDHIIIVSLLILEHFKAARSVVSTQSFVLVLLALLGLAEEFQLFVFFNNTWVGRRVSNVCLLVLLALLGLA